MMNTERGVAYQMLRARQQRRRRGAGLDVV